MAKSKMIVGKIKGGLQQKYFMDWKLTLQAILIGVAVSEIWYFSTAIGNRLNQYIEHTGAYKLAFFLIVVSAFLASAYVVVRGGYPSFKKLVFSGRFDLFLSIIFGIAISAIVDGIWFEKYKKILLKIPLSQLTLLTFLPIFGIALYLSKICVESLLWFFQKNGSAIFISDQAIREKNNDYLNVQGQAEGFAEKVLNGGASDSLVFGLDAPWGSGKSSFVNFCEEYWISKKTQKIIVHRFEPLRYESTTDLPGKFIDDLVSTIQMEVFAPSIRPLFSKYSRLIKGTSDFSLFGLRLEPRQETIDEVLRNLEMVLLRLKARVIIVVDDLDRLPWSSVKDMLFAMKRSFMLPNISYVLCYDTENILALQEKNDDAEKVVEFLEKFINIKTSLFIESASLRSYLERIFDDALSSNLQIEFSARSELKQLLNTLLKIFESEEFHLYRGFLGDIRKLKRLVNTLIVLGVGKNDFRDSDIDQEDLIHLLLVYLNYPAIFRKIYNTEYSIVSSFFSVTKDHASKKYLNSTEYENYKKDLNVHQVFLLDKVFSFENQEYELLPPGEKLMQNASRACFNGTSNRNLSRYLDIILSLTKDIDRIHYRFYVNQKKRLCERESPEEIFGQKQFDHENGDASFIELARVITNSSNDFKRSEGLNMIAYLIKRLPELSLVNSPFRNGSRTTAVYCILSLVNKGLIDYDAFGRRIDEAKDSTFIARKIFGEAEFLDAGILSELSSPERGILGIYDLLLFRLYCSADRSTELFNIQKSLSEHFDLSAPQSGLTSDLAKLGMREISQKVFQIFKARYISKKENVFKEIDELSVSDLAGKYRSSIEKESGKEKLSEIDVNRLVVSTKSGITGFVIYQLANTMINSGVGCGMYDEEGVADCLGISDIMNQYIFDFCFSSDHSTNMKYFVDYLMISFARDFGFGGMNVIPSLDESYKVLKKSSLKEYWHKNGSEIKKLRLEETQGEVVTSNYTVSYANILPSLYEELDRLVME